MFSTLAGMVMAVKVHFNQLKNEWMKLEQLQKKITIILIGNKNDLEIQRKVTKEQGKEKANKIEAAFMETSALSGDNLEKAFVNDDKWNI